MNPEYFRTVSRLISEDVVLSDTELRAALKVYECLINFFSNGKNELVRFGLVMQENRLIDIAWARGIKTREVR